MTEAEWLTSTDPQTMLAWLADTTHGPCLRVTDRKLRLFACACCRQAWHLLTDERSRRAVEVAERYADGEATEVEVTKAWAKAWSVARAATGDAALAAARAATWSVAREAARDAALAAARAAARVTMRQTQAALLRCLCGNPWRPVLILQEGELHQHVGSEKVANPPKHISQAVTHHYERVSWLTPALVVLARSIYDARDWESLPVLCDALEEAGCTAPALLEHGRDPGPHARGCWSIDLVLGKE